MTFPLHILNIIGKFQSLCGGGGLEKFFIVFGNFCCKTSYFTQKKNIPHLYRTFEDEFYKGFHKYNTLQVKIKIINNNFKKIFNKLGI